MVVEGGGARRRASAQWLPRGPQIAAHLDASPTFAMLLCNLDAFLVAREAASLACAAPWETQWMMARPRAHSKRG